jgi:hypothetical protein
MSLVPIVLFVYNRPDHALITLEALKGNTLAAESELFIYCDNYKTNASETDIAKVSEVRAVVSKIEGFKRLEIIERDRNWGLADSIVDGVSSILESYESVIVLEDDILTSPGFLQYMNDALNLYKNEDQVMHVSGYMFPVEVNEKESTFFYNTASCWGWGTWRRAWEKYEGDAKKLHDAIIEDGKVKEFSIGGHADFFDQIEANIKGDIKTWAVKWYASFFLHEGLALHPLKSLTNNIGHDNTGDNCVTTDLYNTGELSKSVALKKVPLVTSKKAWRAMRHFYRMNNTYHKSGRLTKIVYKVFNLLHQVF